MDNNELLHHSKTWDRSGVFVATLCLIHCLGLPFLVALLPTTRVLFDSRIFEIIVLGLGISVGSISFFTTYKKHRNIFPMLLGFFGVACLVTNLVLINRGSAHHHNIDLSPNLHSLQVDPLMIMGGIFLIAGHIWNIHACHCFCDKSCGHQH